MWLVRKVCQVWEGGFRWRGRYLATVDCATSIPNFEQFAVERGAPQRIGLTHPSNQVANFRRL